MDTGFRYSVTESGILLIIDDYKARLQVIVKPTLEFFNIVIYEEQYLKTAGIVCHYLQYIIIYKGL